MKKLKNLILIILIIAVAVGIGFLVFRAVKSIDYNKNAKNPVLTLDVEGYGEVKIELQPDYAPNTVATIVKLAQNGYYDGKVFYGTDSKVVAAGMKLTTKETPSTPNDGEENNNVSEGEEVTKTQTAEEDKLRVSDLDKNVKPYISVNDEEYRTADERKIGTEEEDYKIAISGEFVANNFNDNTLRFERGVVGLYRNNYSGNGDNLNSESYNSGTSLFFISTGEDSRLNGEYAAFGKVIKGMDIIDKMLELPLEQNDEDAEVHVNEGEEEIDKITKYAEGSFPVIKKATVETYGVDYGMPEYIEAFDYDRYMSDMILQYYQNQ